MHPPFRIPYRPKSWIMLLSALFFALCCAVLVSQALNAEHRLSLFRLITLDPGQARIFYAIMAAVAAVLTTMGLAGLWRAFQSPNWVEITDSAIRAPRNGFSRTPTELALSDITDLERVSISGQEFLHIHHANGKLTLNRAMMDTKSTFETCISELVSRMETISARHGRSQHQE